MKDMPPLDSFFEYRDEIQEILIPAADIQMRAAEMGARISQDYAPLISQGRSLVLIGALSGVFMFLADLCRYITLPTKVFFMDVMAHEEVTRRTGIISLAEDLGRSVEDEHVLFIEAIIDHGLTLNYALRALSLRQPASLEVCTMFNKEKHRVIDTRIKYIGYELPEIYVVGYGLDYKGRYRNLPFLAMLKR